MLVVKNPPANADGHKRHWFDPWVRKIPWRRTWQPIPVFLPGESQGQRSLVGYSPWGHKESEWSNFVHYKSKGKSLSVPGWLLSSGSSGSTLLLAVKIQNRGHRNASHVHRTDYYSGQIHKKEKKTMTKRLGYVIHFNKSPSQTFPTNSAPPTLFAKGVRRSTSSQSKIGPDTVRSLNEQKQTAEKKVCHWLQKCEWHKWALKSWFF